MFLSKSILSLLSLVMLISVSRVHGDGTAGDVCLEELAEYQTCAMNSQNFCESGCSNAEQPELSEEDYLSMMADPNFMCDWFNEIFCAIQRCCNACNNEASAYYSCLAAQTTEDGSCAFVCTENDGTVGNGSGNGSNNGGTVDDGSNNDGTGTSAGGGSSASPLLLKMKAWTALFVMIVGYTML